MTERPVDGTSGRGWTVEVGAYVDVAEYTEVNHERPPAPVGVDWAEVEEWLGLPLPGDYKQLADTYGPLDFGEYLWIHVPCAQGERFDYGTWLHGVRRRVRAEDNEAQDHAGQDGHEPEHPHPALHPAPGGLLAFGESRGSDLLFWDTSASENPDAWPVVVRHLGAVPGSGLEPWHHYDLNLTGYLRHTVRAPDEVPTPPGPLIGPLRGTVARTAYLAAVRPWTPPRPEPPRLTGEKRRHALETGTGLEALRLLCPPPDRPYLGNGTTEPKDAWQALFDELGTALPGEYTALMEEYGAGCWAGWLRFLTPLRTGERRMASHLTEITEAYRSLRDDFPEWYPLAVWPEPGGFLPFANSVDGDELGWLTTEKNPDDWPLVFWPRHADQGPPLDRGLTDMLLGWLRGTYRTEGLTPHDAEDPLDAATFEGWTDGGYW
ncbi:SMI1/KNR4 family protein [Streptomyces sp. HNM0574]|uniref:SMI1/KNR4 family protein n=1 Tax=Streptomyces sp. HNM0574 TaxID=2714954 RepID=UPI00146E4D3E|nr:SMI1/KNR4 family protein [Streptomyces sp. HNM0574]NLU70987.1 SMI1/KNR4 family protein [Streptomyces sp. HNM0574]